MMMISDLSATTSDQTDSLILSYLGAKWVLLAEMAVFVVSLYVTITDSGSSLIPSVVLHTISVAILLVTTAVLWRHLEHQHTKLSKAERLVAHSTTEYGRIINQYFTDWKLTASEAQVAIYVMKGFSNAEIAGLRGTSEATIKSQLNSIFRKSGASSRQNLVCFIFEDFARLVTHSEDALGLKKI